MVARNRVSRLANVRYRIVLSLGELFLLEEAGAKGAALLLIFFCVSWVWSLRMGMVKWTPITGPPGANP